MSKVSQSENMKWHERFLDLADVVATWSKDPSTKCGAVLVRPDKTVASLGFNGFPKTMDDDDKLYEIREIKYDRVIHAEMNAILFCRDSFPLHGYTLYTSGPCCSRCIVHMLQVGIRKFVWPKATPEQQIRWNVNKTYEYLREVDASLIEVIEEKDDA